MGLPEEKKFATICHLLGLLIILFPILNIIGPLIYWQSKKSESDYVNDQGKEAVNFQISVTIYIIFVFFVILTMKLSDFPASQGFLSFIIFLIVAIWFFDVVMVIVASIRANKGEKYRYPLSIRFIT